MRFVEEIEGLEDLVRFVKEREGVKGSGAFCRGKRGG